jgi:hypothetical protein
MKLHQLTFHGGILERGFWLYVWRIKHNEELALYVGRTGDSSSRYASSPFSRVGQHLDIRPTAKSNTLLRNIRTAGFSPEACSFEMLAVGPLFSEQTDITSHREHRDILAPLEAQLAEHLRKQGHKILGSHPKAKPFDQELFRQVLDLLEGKL